MKKKEFGLKKALWIGGIPAVIGAVIFMAKNITTYADLPKEVQKTEADVTDIKDYIKEQKMANDLMEKLVTDKNKEVISPDGKYFFDKESGKWLPIRGR